MSGEWLGRVRGRWSQVGGLVQMGGQLLVLFLSMKGPRLASVGGRGYLPQMLLLWWCLRQPCLHHGWEGGHGRGGGGGGNPPHPKANLRVQFGKWGTQGGPCWV